MMTLNQALDDIMQLDDNSREMLLDILQKRQVEKRRDEIAKNAKQARKDFNDGNFTAMSGEEVINYLHSLK